VTRGFTALPLRPLDDPLRHCRKGQI
jgi:hypothetical protein